MKISARTEYACIAILELAARYGSSDPARVRELAKDHKIPARFLVQILLQMKAAGFVSSTRGASGGYQLNRPPDEITLAEVMAAIDGPAEIRLNNPSFETPMTRALQNVWGEATSAQQQVLASVTVAELLDHSRDVGQPMYYI